MDTSKTYDRVVNHEWQQRDPSQPLQEAPLVPSAPRPRSEFQFSTEELRVLRECNKESFFQRSMPLGIGLGLTTYVGIQRGFLKPSARFGPFPKVTLAVIVGYFIGKVSYQQACAEKLMSLPGSYIGQLLRDRRDGRNSSLPNQAPTAMFGAKPDDIYSDAGPGSSLNLDTDRPLFSEDTYQPGTSIPPGGQDVSGPLQPNLSYDDLRRKNRGEYTDARQNPYKMEPSLAPPPPQRPPQASSASTHHTNKYGDVID